MVTLKTLQNYATFKCFTKNFLRVKFLVLRFHLSADLTEVATLCEIYVFLQLKEFQLQKKLQVQETLSKQQDSNITNESISQVII